MAAEKHELDGDGGRSHLIAARFSGCFYVALTPPRPHLPPSQPIQRLFRLDFAQCTDSPADHRWVSGLNVPMISEQAQPQPCVRALRVAKARHEPPRIPCPKCNLAHSALVLITIKQPCTFGPFLDLRTPPTSHLSRRVPFTSTLSSSNLSDFLDRSSNYY